MSSDPRLASAFTSRSRFAFIADERGSLLEYAIIFILFMAMLFGIAEFGHLLYADHFVSNAAKEATRYAAVHGSTCNDDSSCSVANPDTGPALPTNTVIQDFVGTMVPPGIDGSTVGSCGGTANLVVCPGWPVGTECTSEATPAGCTPAACQTTSNAPGCPVQVTVSYKFHFIFPLISPSPITLTSTSQTIIAH